MSGAGSGRHLLIVCEPLAGRILPTALTLFGEHGYHGTSMQRIADALGVYVGRT